MRLIMGMSSDGYVAARPDDEMQWLGPDDKTAFRLLTNVGGDCFASRKTLSLMPQVLPGRTLYAITRTPAEGRSHECTLDFAHKHGANSWLLGGQHLALVALGLGYIDEAHLCVSGVECPNPVGLPDRRIADMVSTMVHASMKQVAENRVGLTVVRTFRK